MNLDEGLRTRLRAVIEKEPEGGDGRRWDRLASRVAEAGPGVLRSARRRRAVVLAGSVLLALAAPVTAWLLLRTAGGASTAPPRPRSRISAVRRNSPGAVERLPVRRFGRLDLGRVGRIVVEADADASLVEHAACRTELALTGGRVTVHARELGGGILRVHTSACDVVVHGRSSPSLLRTTRWRSRWPTAW